MRQKKAEIHLNSSLQVERRDVTKSWQRRLQRLIQDASRQYNNMKTLTANMRNIKAKDIKTGSFSYIEMKTILERTMKMKMKMMEINNEKSRIMQRHTWKPTKTAKMEQMQAGRTRARGNLALPRTNTRINPKFVVYIDLEYILGALRCLNIWWLEAPLLCHSRLVPAQVGRLDPVISIKVPG